MIPELDERSREIFKNIVDAYVATGEPIGSRTLSKRLNSSLSPATVRNVMSDLEDAGLLFSRASKVSARQKGRLLKGF